MHGFNLVDAIVAAVIILSAILAYSRGLVRETMAIAGWVAAAVGGFILAPMVEPLVKEVPIINKFLAGNCELSMVAAFAASFAVVLVVVSLFTPFLASFIHNSALSGVDSGLGFLFGAARGVLLIAVGFMVYHQAMATKSLPMVDASRSDKIFASVETNLKNSVPTDVPTWIVGRYKQLTATCPTSGASAASLTKPAPTGTASKTTAPAASGKTAAPNFGNITATQSN